MAKKRRIRKEIKYLFVVVLIITAVSAVVFGGKYIRFMDVKSVNSDAKKIINNHCLAFYPDGSNKDMKKTAEKLCDGVSDDSVFDYQKTVMGEYILIDYRIGSVQRCLNLIAHLAVLSAILVPRLWQSVAD